MFVLCAFFSAGIVPAFSQQIEKSIVLKNQETIGFLEYKPTNYATEGNVKHPLIIFLHGIGERGNGTTDLKYVARTGLPRVIKQGHNMKFTWNGKTETFLVISPQCPLKYGMWPQMIVDELIQYAKTNLRIDPDRIYLTGLSMGGGGTLKYISTAPQNPTNISAAATICAPCTFDKGEYVADAKLPVWAFHAADDSVALASCTDRAINRINAANPEVKPLRSIWPTGGHQVWDRVYSDTNYKNQGIINIYEWFLAQNRTLKPNKIPVANAGRDLTVSTKQAQVILDASASTDADGKLVRYVWKKLSGPAAGTIAQPMSANASTTLTGLTQGIYQYELAVVDDRAAFTRDTVKITVAAIEVAPIPNKAPVVFAGNDTTITLPAALSLKGSATDADGTIASYSWSKISGPAVSIASASDATTKLDNLVAGVYIFRLTATDNSKAAVSSDVKVTVLAAAPKPDTTMPDTTKPNTSPKPDTTKPDTSPKPDDVKPSTPPKQPVGNKAPITVAGPDQTIPIEWNYFPVVNASATKDPDGWIKLFTWTKISGPDSYNIVDPKACKTRINNLVAGTYVFRVTATDNLGATSYDDLTIVMTQKEQRSVASKSVLEDEVAVNAVIPVTKLTMVQDKLSLYPNPAASMVNLQYASEATGKSAITVYDVAGRLVKNIPFTKTTGVYQHNLDINELKNGVYYVQVKTGGTLMLQTKLLKK